MLVKLAVTLELITVHLLDLLVDVLELRVSSNALSPFLHSNRSTH
jgi:hypothetical protein